MSTATAHKIKKIREFRNYTQEHMAEKLGMSQNAYSKIESGQTKLDTDRLLEIAKILSVPVESILSEELQIFNSNNGQNNNFYAGYIVNMHEENKELAQTTIKTLEGQVAHLQKENERLIAMLESKL